VLVLFVIVNEYMSNSADFRGFFLKNDRLTFLA